MGQNIVNGKNALLDQGCFGLTFGYHPLVGSKLRPRSQQHSLRVVD